MKTYRYDLVLSVILNQNCLDSITGKQLIDYIADYLDNIRERRVFPDVSPGYLRPLIPDNAPEQGETWETIFSDVERVIMPGVSINLINY